MKTEIVILIIFMIMVLIILSFWLAIRFSGVKKKEEIKMGILKFFVAPVLIMFFFYLVIVFRGRNNYYQSPVYPYPYYNRPFTPYYNNNPFINNGR